MSDDTLVRAAENWGEAYRTWVAGLDLPWQVWDDLLVADMGLPVPLPPTTRRCGHPSPMGRSWT